MAAVDNWRTCLNDQSFCKQLRENNAKDSGQKHSSTSKCLTALQGGDLYVWDSYSAHIVYYNLKHLLPDCVESDRNQAQVNTVQSMHCVGATALRYNLIALIQYTIDKSHILSLRPVRRPSHYTFPAKLVMLQHRKLKVDCCTLKNGHR